MGPPWELCVSDILTRVRKSESPGNVVIKYLNATASKAQLPTLFIFVSFLCTIVNLYHTMEATLTMGSPKKIFIPGIHPRCSSSLRQSIREGRPKPTKGSGESTVHLDIEPVELDGLTVRIYDCAGQVRSLKFGWARILPEHASVRFNIASS